MDTLIPQGERQALVATDVNNRMLGLSPTKKQYPLPPPTSLARSNSRGEESLQQYDNIGLQAVDTNESSAATHSYVIVSHQSIALLLGRARNATEEVMPPVNVSDSQKIGSTPIRRIPLPSSAKHVSRDHAVIFSSPFGSAWALKILGQNGLIVNGKRKRAGVIVKLVPFETMLDFFGVKCLFLGSGQEKKDAVLPQEGNSKLLLHQAPRVEYGQSPTKRDNATFSRPSLGTNGFILLESQDLPLQSRNSSTSPLKRKLVGNPLKRPTGAPPSPPTSSPAPFSLFSSPVKTGTSQKRHLLASSSPAPALSESEISSDEEGYEAAGSPSLTRRAAKHDDSGVMFDQDSADEASQALSTNQRPAIIPDNDGDDDEDDEDDVEESISDEDDKVSPSPTPLKKRSEKRVKFTAQDTFKVESKDKSNNGVPRNTPASSLSLSCFQKIQSHLRTLVATLAETYDLQGLLAQAIVFHRTATISATEAVRSVLSSTPGLLRGEVGPDRKAPAGTTVGTILTGWTFEEIMKSNPVGLEEVDKDRVETWQKKAWREKMEACLMEGDCFGIISRAGKDASGNPLECWYYYDKDGDAGKFAQLL